MKMPKSKIEFYRRRDFGEKMSATFDFIGRNLKPLLVICTCLLLPVALIQGIFLNSYTGSISEMTSLPTSAMENEMGRLMGPLTGSVAGLTITSLLSACLLIAAVYTLMQKYNEEGTLEGVTFASIKTALVRNAKRGLGALLFLTLVLTVYILIVGLLVFISPWTALATIPAFFVLLFPSTLIYTCYLFEPISIWRAFKKAYRLGFATWGGLFLMVVLTSIIAGIIQGVASTPWYIAFMAKSLLTHTGNESEFVYSGGFRIMQYFFSVILVLGSFLSSMVVYIGQAYQYASAREKVEPVSISADIDQFEQL